jgi:hypothetical protein
MGVGVGMGVGEGIRVGLCEGVIVFVGREIVAVGLGSGVGVLIPRNCPHEQRTRKAVKKRILDDFTFLSP